MQKLLAHMLALAVTGLCGTVYGAAITVPNFSFEANAGGDGGFVASADDWVITGSFTNAGSYNPVDAQFTGTSSGGNVPSPGEGTDIHLSNLDRSGVAGSDFSVFTSAASLASVTEIFLYTLTVAGGNRASSATPDQYTIELLVDDGTGPTVAAVTIFDGNTIPADSFQDITTSFTATAGQAGSDLTIRLTHSTYAGSSFSAGHFDNVRLDAVLIPEPSSLALVFITMFGAILVGKCPSRMS